MPDADARLRALADKLFAVLARHTHPDAALLAGSVAKGEADELSDIDLLIYHAHLPPESAVDAARAEAGGQDHTVIALRTEPDSSTSSPSRASPARSASWRSPTSRATFAGWWSISIPIRTPWFSSFQFKRTRALTARLAASPAGLADRLESLFTLPAADRAAELERLTDEVRALLAERALLP